MPQRNRRMRNRKALSRAERAEVKRIAERLIDEEIEDKAQVGGEENLQLYHNKPIYVQKILAAIQQGVETGDQSTGGAGSLKVRVGDQINLKNVNIRFWLSNKLDRPNVMYKGVLFWYAVGQTMSDALVYKTQTNKMLDRYNDKQIKIIDTFLVKSTQMYDNGTEKWEHSYLATLNKSYKNKKIQYDDNGPVTKGWELGFGIVCYDAFGTLQTDNIASFAYNLQLTFQDA